MAKPPELIEDVISQAVLIIDGEVAEVLKTGVAPETLKVASGTTSSGQLTAAQTVKIRVKRVIKGQAETEITVEKPAAQYALRAGNHGPFLIDSQHTILGRFGPDSWSFDRIEKALGK
jgi:hypothetical protein